MYLIQPFYCDFVNNFKSIKITKIQNTKLIHYNYSTRFFQTSLKKNFGGSQKLHLFLLFRFDNIKNIHGCHF